MKPTKRFYVYTLIRPDGRIFYVGKGTRHRIDCHEKEARKGCGCHKCRVIRKIWDAGGVVRKEIVFSSDDELETYQREIQSIAQIGLSNLTNVDPGGDVASRRPVRALPDKPVTEITDAEYLDHLRNIVGMTPKRMQDMLERFRYRKMHLLERSLKRAQHNQRLNEWDMQPEIDRLSKALDDVYISLGMVNQECFC